MLGVKKKRNVKARKKMRKQPSEYHKQDIGSIYYPWAWESKGVNVSPEPRSILVNISCLFCVRRYCGGEPNTRLQTCTFCQISSCIKLEIKSMLVTQSCLTFCDLMDCGPWCFSVNEIHQTRMLEWVAIPSSGFSQPRGQTLVSCIAGRFFIIWATKEGLPQSQPT